MNRASLLIALGLVCLSAVWPCAAAGSPPEVVFIPIKIDGPVHDPANGSYWFGPFNESCSLVDVNGDGRLDITCGVNWYEAPKWKKHHAYFEGAEKYFDGTQWRELLHSHCREVALDVNRDGLVDVVDCGEQKGVAGVWWYENPGPRGGKWKARRIRRSPYMEGILPVDLNGDGYPDLLMNHWRDSDNASAPIESVAWLESIDKEPWLVEHMIAAKTDDHGAGAGDINGDGRPDVVGRHGWYETPPKPAGQPWRFHPDYELPYRASFPMLVTDANGDGRADILVGNSHGYGLDWLEQRVDGQGKRSFVRHAIEEHYANFHTMTLADVNGDGKPDLVTGSRLFGHNGIDEGEWDPLFLFWYDIRGGKFERHVISFNYLQYYAGQENVNPPPQYAAGTGMKISVGDINDDGKPDVVVAGRGGLYAFINRGLSPRPKSVNPQLPTMGVKCPEAK
jgi:hypothetical protein